MAKIRKSDSSVVLRVYARLIYFIILSLRRQHTYIRRYFDTASLVPLFSYLHTLCETSLSISFCTYYSFVVGCSSSVVIVVSVAVCGRL